MATGALRQGRRVFREDVKEHLIDAILTGKLAAGDRIIETQVASVLGVSQGPVREALRDLELLGFVDSMPFRGAQVRQVSFAEILQIYPIRAAVEGVVAHAAASQIDDGLLEALLVELREHYDQMRAAAARGDDHAHVEADIAFHRAIVYASGNRLLRQFWDSMQLATTTFMSLILTHRDLHELCVRHEPILAALEARDADAAERAARWHIEELRGWILAAGEPTLDQATVRAE
jgi:DNA-binding GntR family transcriptional regulator